MGMTIDEAIKYFETFRDEIPGLIQEQHARLEDTEDFDREMQEQIDATNFALSALRDQQARENQKPQWISVKDRLPDRGAKVLTRDKWGHIRDRALYIFEDGTKIFRPDGLIPEKDVTHWMPLPEPPKAVEK